MSSKSIKNFQALEDYRSSKLEFRFGLKYVIFNKLFSYDIEKVYENSCLMYRDLDHFSFCGEELLAKKMKKDTWSSLKKEFNQP